MLRALLPRLLVCAAIVAVAILGASCIIDECDDGICVPDTSTGGAGGTAGEGGTAGQGGTASQGGSAGEGGAGGGEGGGGGN